ncbi:MAG: hypothetical protein ABIH34_06865 [Nanoarchaeota archaeon]
MERTIVCESCRKAVPVDEIRYMTSPTGQKKLCTTCKPRALAKPQIHVKEQTKLQYQCAHCKYKFKHDSMSPSRLSCPYCGRTENIMQVKSPSF